MELKQENYLIDYLKRGSKLNISLFADQAYFSKLSFIKCQYDNLKWQFFNESDNCLAIAKYDVFKKITDCDLIIYYSSKFYNSELLKGLIDIAMQVSKNNVKHITIGYAYLDEDNVLNHHIEVLNYYNGGELSKGIMPLNFQSNILYLIEQALIDYETYKEDNLIKRKIKLNF